jgi:hypothetical protein
MINVLDKGYVRLVDHMGSDLTVVNAARVSYAKQSHELNERDIKLIKFLARYPIFWRNGWSTMRRRKSAITPGPFTRSSSRCSPFRSKNC